MFSIIVRDTDQILDTAETWFEAAAIQTHLQRIWKVALLIESTPQS